jgi:large subunit ribosomal protein L32
MAVQKNRTTPSKRGMRRGHDGVSSPALSTEATTGETHIRHHISADGYYRGKQVIASRAAEEEAE